MSNPYQPGQAMPNKPIPGGGGPKPKNYLVESILLLVCCAGLFAIPAIIYATQVDSKYSSGDYAGAVESSNNAKKWCLIALCIGLFCGGGSAILYVLVIAMGVAGGAM